jgi:hypothetical protein
MATAPIAGPRRARAPAATPAESPLDYGETSSAEARQLESTQPGKRLRTNRVRWFVLGIAFGAVAAVVATGDAPATLSAARAWGASALRSLEHKPSPAATTAPSSMATGAGSRGKVPWEAPCPVEPAAGDPCAALLAPFTGESRATREVPVVSVDDLPRVKPAPAIFARRHRTAAPSATPQPPSTGEEERTAETQTGIDPYADDPQTSPTRVVPTASPPQPPAERQAPEPPATELSSVQNEPT